MLICPKEFNVDFGKKLIKYLDPTANILIIDKYWCWKDFGEQFGYLLPKIKQYLNNCGGNPSHLVYYLYQYCGLSTKWTKRFIENCKIGNPSIIAYNLVIYYEWSRIWAEKIVEKSKVGNPAGVAYLMAKDYKSSQKWAKKIIENSKIGDPLRAAYLLTKHCYLYHREWAEKIIENSKIGNPIFIASCMVKHCGSSKEWAQKIICRYKS